MVLLQCSVMLMARQEGSLRRKVRPADCWTSMARGRASSSATATPRASSSARLTLADCWTSMAKGRGSSSATATMRLICSASLMAEGSMIPKAILVKR